MIDRLPDYRVHGFEAVAVLGNNAEGGRRALRATRLDDGVPVVIKEFSFATPDASWEHYAAHERELAVLTTLDHPRIPAYLGDFQTDNGFCMVQMFCHGTPMGAAATSSLDEVIEIARSGLEVLAFLQSRVPPVVHRDIKPGNLLIDDHGQVHLVDFGLARTELSASSTVAVGTPGFIPPEQLLGHALTTATDLYGFGVSLFCLIAGIRAEAASQHVDSGFKLDLRAIEGATPAWFRHWLSKLVDPKVTERWSSADAALRALAAARARGTTPKPKTRTPTRPAPRPKVAAQSYRKPGSGGSGFGRDEVEMIVMVTLLLTVGAWGEVAGWCTPSTPASWWPTTTVTCDRPMHLSEDLLRVPQDHHSALVTRQGCVLTASNIKITGGISVQGGYLDLVGVHVVGGAQRALLLNRPATVRMKGGSITCGPSPSCVFQSQGDLTLRGVTLHSDDLGVYVSGGKTVIVDSAIEGAKVGLAVKGVTARVAVQAGTLVGGRALRVEHSETITIANTAITGLLDDQMVGTIDGLDTADIDYGDQREHGVSQAVCAPIIPCLKTHSQGPFVVDLRATVNSSGDAGGFTLLRETANDALDKCLQRSIQGRPIRGAGGHDIAVRCTATGSFSSAGMARLSTHFRAEKGGDPAAGAPVP